MREGSYGPEPDSRLFAWLINLRNRHFMLLDAAVILFSALLSVLSIHGLCAPWREWVAAFAGLSLLIKLAGLYAAGVYRRF